MNRLWLPGAGCRSGPVFCPRAAEKVRHPVVSLVAGILVHHIACLVQRNGGRPRCCPRSWIARGDLIVDSIGVEAGEAFDQAQALGGASELVLTVEIRRFDDERVSLPAAAGVA